MNPTKVARRAVHQYGALQKVGELAGFLSLLAENPPKTVVEIGCDAGGTLWAWKQAGAQRVIGVSMADNAGGFASGKPLERHGAEVVSGDSHDLDTLDELKKRLGDDKIDLLFIDGDHTYEGVKLDFAMYAALVDINGIIAFHDICHHPRHPDVGVEFLWEKLGGDKEEIVTEDDTWGGIGVIRLPQEAAARLEAATAGAGA